MAHLCRTSKKLLAIATPHLYHRPAEGPWWLLLRTLIARPDLALHVRYLLDDRLWQSTVSTIIALFTPSSFDQEIWSRFSGLAAYLDELRGGILRQSQDGFAGIVMLREQPTIFEFFVSLCPNVQEIATGILLCHLFTDQPSGSLQHVRHVQMTLDSSCELLGEPMFQGFALIARLAIVAPNVRSIVCRFVMQSAQIRHRLPIITNLVQLHLHKSTLTLLALARILAACPNLRSFLYHDSHLDRECPGMECFTPWQAQEAILRYAPALTSLDLNISDDFELRSPADTVQSLRRLSELEHLSLDLTSLIPGIDPLNGMDPVQVPNMDPVLLVRLLPASIRSLRLCWSTNLQDPRFEFKHLREPLMRLAAATQDQFPALRSIAVSLFDAQSGTEEGMDDVKAVTATFRKLGIRTHIE
ncbi:hypothetical protein N658DRAFT_510732 [Parathielavia hyrcaniae]|uniref:F-box domain-containing protein n=1 Tax=Parathielavia hyrcaniae TaxID=113614 RepID=A0AAN6PUT9_9PEZI|nr:hypothetical protein N658DRAFT_510732 [Parathielavia hyrcaniae]